MSARAATFLAWLRRGGVDGRIVGGGDDRRVAVARLILAVDASWAIGNLAYGIWAASFWFITLGACYLLLAAMRALLIFGIRRGEGTRAVKTMRICGLLVASLAFVDCGFVALASSEQGGFVYPEAAIYAVATYGFVSLGASVGSFASNRRHANQLMFALSNVNLANALVSILALEMAMVTLFSSSDDPSFIATMNLLTGGMVIVADIALGLLLVRRSKQLAAR